MFTYFPRKIYGPQHSDPTGYDFVQTLCKGQAWWGMAEGIVTSDLWVYVSHGLC